ncbi:MAG: ATP-binding protein [Puniceicoccaceae bacterium]
MFVLLSLLVILALLWLWRSETRETAGENETALDLQRIRFDLDLISGVDAVRHIESISRSTLSPEDFRDALRAAVRSNPRLRRLGILDRGGNPILVASADSADPRDRIVSVQEDGGMVPGDTYLEDLRSLNPGGVLVSGFVAADGSPAIRAGVGLFFQSGARAGFVVAELSAEQVLERMTGGTGTEAHDLFIVGSDGRWIYDSRQPEPWALLRGRGAAGWIFDEFPDAWRSMISEGDGSHAAGDVWAFREHVPIETLADDGRAVLSPDGGDAREVSAKPFFIARRIDDSPVWSDVWAGFVPIAILYVLTLAWMIPALLRKREALARSEESANELHDAMLRTRMAMEAARISEWRIDLNAGTIATDQRVMDMLLLGKGKKLSTVAEWEERMHPNDRRKVFDTLEPLWEAGMGTFSVRHRMRRGDGSWGWYRFRGAVRRDDDRSGRFILGAYIDLTDIVLREAELNRLEMATRQSLSGIAILDKAGSLEWANPAFRERPERAGMELLQRPAWELVAFPEGDAEDEKHAVRDAILRGEEFSLTVASHPSGSEASWRRITGNPVLDQGGLPTHYVVIETDISREKRVDAELRKSESLLAESQRLVGIGSWEIDLEEDTFFWSDENYRIFGTSRDFLPDIRGALGFFNGDDKKAITDHLEEAVRSGKPFEGEYPIRAGDGSRKWVFLKGMALREAGITSKIFGIVQDISSRKDYEEALVHAKEEAEQLNDKLADALDKAHASERKAREANEAKSAFLSMISHEIRNPLNGVIGMTTLLRDTALDDVQEDYVETIHNSGSSLLMLLDDILDFSKIEHGKIEFEQKRFPVDGTVKDSLDLFAIRLARKGLDFAYRIDPEVPDEVSGDVTRVKQILFNLIGNSVKFTETGFVSVEVDLRERLPNDRCLLVFTVRDTGIGIPEEHHDRVFQSFNQVDPSITRKFGGTGLGLAISKELAQRMGGDIRFESAPGKGSSFEVVLPFPAFFEDRRRRRTAAPESEGRALCWFRMETRARHFESVLSEAGFEVETSPEPTRFAAALREAPPGTRIFADEEILAEPGVAGLLRARSAGGTARPPVLVCRHGSQPDLPFESITVPRHASRSRILATLEAPGEKQTKKSREDARAAPPAALDGSMKILIAEDNAVNQKVIRLLLKRMGYDCVVVDDGKAALRKAKEETFDLILMDIQMPEMDGIEAAGRINAEVPPERRPWIVALTAGATRDNRDEAIEAGMNGYLTKPIQPGDLESELAKAAANTRARA